MCRLVSYTNSTTLFAFSAKESKIHMEELTQQFSKFVIVQGMLQSDISTICFHSLFTNCRISRKETSLASNINNPLKMKTNLFQYLFYSEEKTPSANGWPSIQEAENVL